MYVWCSILANTWFKQCACILSSISCGLCGADIRFLKCGKANFLIASRTQQKYIRFQYVSFLLLYLFAALNSHSLRADFIFGFVYILFRNQTPIFPFKCFFALVMQIKHAQHGQRDSEREKGKEATLRPISLYSRSYSKIVVLACCHSTERSSMRFLQLYYLSVRFKVPCVRACDFHYLQKKDTRNGEKVDNWTRISANTANERQKAAPITLSEILHE